MNNTYLVVDVETTGLPEKKSGKEDYSSCRLVQIAWIKFTCEGQLQETKSFLTKTIPIPPEITKIHKITDDDVKQNGVDVQIALNEFMTDIRNSRLIVAHNIIFDLSVIEYELELLGRNQDIDFLETIPSRCTCFDYPLMVGEKSRKLGDRYFKCFGKYPDTQHDALADAKSCAEIFFWFENGMKLTT